MKENVCKGLNALAAECHRIAVDHGWWDKPPSFGETVVMCHAELSEAVEEYRDGMPMAYVEDSSGDQFGSWIPEENPEKWGDKKPEGVAVEMADCLIRLLDWFGANGLDVETIVARKCAYNETRTYRHGNKAL